MWAYPVVMSAILLSIYLPNLPVVVALTFPPCSWEAEVGAFNCFPVFLCVDFLFIYAFQLSPRPVIPDAFPLCL